MKKIVPKALVVKPEDPTPARYLEMYGDTFEGVVRELEGILRRRTEALATISLAIADSPGSFAYNVSWSKGISEDLLAVYAKQTLDALDDLDPIARLVETLRRQVAYIRGAQLSNNYGSSRSTSPFHNAVEDAKADVARYYRERAEGWLLQFDHYRAMGEVL